MKIYCLKKAVPYTILLGVTAVVFLALYRYADLREPLSYEGDSIAGYTMIKSMINTGTWMEDSLLGNGTYQLYEHNTGNTIEFLMIKVLCLFTKNVFMVANIYYYLTFLLASFTAYFVLEKITKHKFVSIVFSLLFAFTPYAQLRSIDGGHLMWLGCYYIIPLSVFACLCVSREWKPKYMYFIIFAAGLSNIYYSYFSAVLLGLACIASWIQDLDRKKEKAEKYIKYLMTLLAALFINLFPSIWFYVNHPSNSSGGVFHRLPQMAEVFGLKMVTLLLPRLDHRCG